MAAPVSIQDSFNAVSKRLVAQMEGEHADIGVGDAVTAAVATEFGVPLDSLLEAIAAEQRVALAMLLLTGPSKALPTIQTAAFLAGVAWEQGRQG